MSIATELARILQAKTDIKTAINDKGGALTTEKIDQYANAIANITTGGGEVSVLTDEEHYQQGDHEIRFFHFDGTLLKSEWVEDGGSATLPTIPASVSPQPTFTLQYWMNEYENMTHDSDVAAIGYPSDGKNYVILRVQDDENASFTLVKIGDGTISWDWGDGSSVETNSNAGPYSTIYLSHTYATEGDYAFTVWVSSDPNVNTLIFFGGLVEGVATPWSSCFSLSNRHVVKAIYFGNHSVSAGLNCDAGDSFAYENISFPDSFGTRYNDYSWKTLITSSSSSFEPFPFVFYPADYAYKKQFVRVAAVKHGYGDINYPNMILPFNFAVYNEFSNVSTNANYFYPTDTVFSVLDTSDVSNEFRFPTFIAPRGNYLGTNILVRGAPIEKWLSYGVLRDNSYQFENCFYLKTLETDYIEDETNFWSFSSRSMIKRSFPLNINAITYVRLDSGGIFNVKTPNGPLDVPNMFPSATNIYANFTKELYNGVILSNNFTNYRLEAYGFANGAELFGVDKPNISIPYDTDKRLYGFNRSEIDIVINSNNYGVSGLQYGSCDWLSGRLGNVTIVPETLQNIGYGVSFNGVTVNHFILDNINFASSMQNFSANTIDISNTIFYSSSYELFSFVTANHINFVANVDSRGAYVESFRNCNIKSLNMSGIVHSSSYPSGFYGGFVDSTIGNAFIKINYKSGISFAMFTQAFSGANISGNIVFSVSNTEVPISVVGWGTNSLFTNNASVVFEHNSNVFFPKIYGSISTDNCVFSAKTHPFGTDFTTSDANTTNMFNAVTFLDVYKFNFVNIRYENAFGRGTTFIGNTLDFGTGLTVIAAYALNHQRNTLFEHFNHAGLKKNITRFIFRRETPISIPTQTFALNTYFQQTNTRIYVPDASVNAYKVATNWIRYANHIFPLSDIEP